MAALRNRMGKVLAYLPSPLAELSGTKPSMRSRSLEKRASQSGILHASSADTLAWMRYQHVVSVAAVQHVFTMLSVQPACWFCDRALSIVQVPCGVSAERVAVAPAEATPECSSWFDAVGVATSEDVALLLAELFELGALLAADDVAFDAVTLFSARATTGDANTGAAAMGAFRSLSLRQHVRPTPRQAGPEPQIRAQEPRVAGQQRPSSTFRSKCRERRGGDRVDSPKSHVHKSFTPAYAMKSGGCVTGAVRRPTDGRRASCACPATDRL